MSLVFDETNLQFPFYFFLLSGIEEKQDYTDFIYIGNDIHCCLFYRDGNKYIRLYFKRCKEEPPDAADGNGEGCGFRDKQLP